jgi:hypothetical protein
MIFMNKYIILLLVSLSVSFGAAAQTNQLEAVKAVAQTNLNQVLIEALSGVKDASGEIYQASKGAIRKSVDFVTEQAPDAVRQFLLWHMVSAIIWTVIDCLFIAFFLFGASRWNKWAKTADTNCPSYALASDQWCGYFWKWAFVGIAIMFLFMGVGSQSFVIAKIAVAPKVYIIEYVVDLAKGGQASQR